MFALHVLSGGYRGLEDARLSIGVIEPGTGAVFDLYQRRTIHVEPRAILALSNGGGAYLAPDLRTQSARRVATRANAAVLPLSRRPRQLSSEFVTGYTEFARDAALFWRSHGVNDQAVLTAGVFALASIQTPIRQTLKLTALLTPHLVVGRLPPADVLESMCVQSGVGLQRSRPQWFAEFERYVPQITFRVNQLAQRDNSLRRSLCIDTPLPTGMSVTKLSFTLALVGNNCGCLDARILNWAYGKNATKAAQELTKKTADGRLSEARYEKYRRAEHRILSGTPYYNADDPVGLARAQWILWENLGESGPEVHDHREMFEAVRDDRFLRLF